MSQPTGQLLATRGQWRITCETTVPDEHAETFYELYLEAFGPMRTLAVARQVLHRDEFLAEMTDSRVWKYVAWDGDGRPMGLATLTRDLSVIPWISPEYFTARYPEHAARNAIYYLGFTVVHPGQRHQRLLDTIFEAGLSRLIDDKAVCAFDVCAFNDVEFGLSDRIEALLHRLADVTVEIIDTQTYYNVTFL